MKKKSIFYLAAAAVSLLAVAALLIGVSFRPRLLLTNQDTGEVYAYWDAAHTAGFEIEFIHSVNLSPVADIYEIIDNKIILTSTRYSSFGAGVPTTLEEGQSLSYDENNNMIISGYDTEMERVLYVVGTIYDHMLKINGEQLNLTQLCGKNAHVCFEIKRCFPCVKMQ